MIFFFLKNEKMVQIQSKSKQWDLNHLDIVL